MHPIKRILALFATVVVAFHCLAAADVRAQDSLPPLKDGKVPQTLDELWGDYDPTSEPIEAKIVREWEEKGIVLRYITYTIGTFKGQKSIMSGFYAFPKGKRNLPAFMDIHGGGGRASLKAVKYGAFNGYAALSVNWGGHQPLSDLKDTDPNTDWGALDATQTGHNRHYNHMYPDGKTLDDVESPRNNNWFLLTLGCRRGITFLQQQPEVNPKLIGVTGHSMGGKITTNVAGIDGRVTVAVPSCGGTGSLEKILSGMPGAGVGKSKEQLKLDTIDDIPYLKRLKCPVMFISPSNDFAGPMDNMYVNHELTSSPFFYFSITPHFNHRHDPEFSVNKLLTFEQFLKQSFKYPCMPQLSVDLKTTDGVPRVKLVADPSMEIEKVDIYYSVDPHVLTRFWRDARAVKEGQHWIAKCPIMRTEHPFFAYANVTYKVDLSNYTQADGIGKHEDRFAISSNMIRLMPDALNKAGIQATDKPERMVDDFKRGYHDWSIGYWDNPHHWSLSTRKLKDPKYRAPVGGKLAVDVKIEQDNTLVFGFANNQWEAYPGQATDHFSAIVEVKGSPDWQTITLSKDDLLPADFIKNTNDQLPDPEWKYVTEFSLRGRATVIQDGQKVDYHEPWKGDRAFRNLRWVGGTYSDAMDVYGGAAELSEEALDQTIKQAIDQSWEGDKIRAAAMHPDARGRVYLTPPMATKTKTFLNLVGQDANIDGDQKISIGGQEYARGLGVHAKSELVFPLDGKYASFHVVPGPADSSNGLLEMKVLVDGRTVFSSGPIRTQSYQPSPLKIPVSGAKQLALVVTDGGNGNGGDHAHWAEAYLTLKK